MIVVCLVLAVLAALLFVGPAPARLVPSGWGHVAGPDDPTASWGAVDRRSALLAWVGCGSGLVVLVACHHWAGPAGLAVGAAVLIAFATCLRLTVHFLRRRLAAKARVDVAHACSVLASQIRVGRVPADALRGAVEDCPVLAAAGQALALGGDVTQVWRASSALPGHAGLSDLARAWQVSTDTGAPLAHSLDQVSESLTADLALRSVVAGELSAPRATGKIMAALPLVGLGMGYLLGGDPVEFLLASPYGWACLVVGVALACAGVLWIERLAQQAGDQG